MAPGEQVKPRLFQALTKDVCPDSNSKSAIQISSFLPSRYALEDKKNNTLSIHGA
jgi:hypothetical protein